MSNFTRYFCMIGVSFALMLSVGADILVGHDERATICATNGEEKVESGVVTISPAARSVDKIGAGSFEIGAGRVRQHSATVALNVHGGALKLTDDGVAPASVARPDDILAKSCLWFDATTNVVFGEDGESVIAWHDARETVPTEGAWVTNRYTAVGTFASSIAGAKLPATRVVDGLRMVYFNGNQSGTFMTFASPKGSVGNVTGLKHVFYVSRHVTGFMYPLGNYGGGVAYFHPDKTDGLIETNGSYNHFISQGGDADPSVTGGRAFLDGVAMDATNTEIPSNRVHLVEYDATQARDMALGQLFGDRTLTGSIYKRSGGDDFGELIAFTNRLTDAECLLVSEYLLGKWEGAKRPSTYAVTAAAQASVAVDVAEDASFCGGAALVQNGGTLAKTGAGELTLRSPTKGEAVYPTLTALEGTLKVNLAEVSVKAQAGEKYQRDTTQIHVAPVTRTTAEADQVAFAGGRWKVSDIGGATRLTATDAEELTLAGAATNNPTAITFASDAIEATIPNAGFEGSDIYTVGTQTSGQPVKNGGWMVQTYYIGSGHFANGNMYIITLPSSNWNVMHPYPAPEGKRIMALKGKVEVWCTVTVPVSGVYELSFMSCHRGDAASKPVDIALVTGTTTNWVARHWAYTGSGFHRSSYRTPWLDKGEHILYLGHTATEDCLPHFDDFHLRLMPEETAKAIPVPNGSFEMATWNGRAACGLLNEMCDTGFSLNSRIDGWTLVQTENATNQPAASPVSRYTQGYYREAGTIGDGQLLLVSKGAAATSPTFTLPAGSWQLTCRIGAWRTQNNASWAWNGNKTMNWTPIVEATVTTNGAVASLGNCTQTGMCAVKATFPNVLVLSQPTQVAVTLTETQDRTGAFIDDVEFVPAETNELITNGTFDSDLSNWIKGSLRDTNDVNLVKCNAYRLYLPQTVYGYNLPPSGNWAVALIQAAWISQEVTFPKAGLYELSFWAGTRCSMDAVNWSGGNIMQYAGNSYDALLIRNGVTNRLYTTGPCVSSNFTHRVCHFKVETAGKATLVFRGRNGEPRGDGTYIATQPTGTGVNFVKNDAYAMIDSVSLKPIEALPAPLDLPEETKISLGATTRLTLDYEGTLPIAELRLGGKKVHGTIDASHRSGLVSGPGALEVPRIGCYLIIR